MESLILWVHVGATLAIIESFLVNMLSRLSCSIVSEAEGKQPGTLCGGLFCPLHAPSSTTRPEVGLCFGSPPNLIIRKL